MIQNENKILSLALALKQTALQGFYHAVKQGGGVRPLLMIPEILLHDISGIMTKAACEVALMGERHVRIEISDFVMRTFLLNIFTRTPHMKNSYVP